MLTIVPLLTVALSLVLWQTLALTLVQPVFESIPVAWVLAIRLASALLQPVAIEAVSE